MDRAATKIVASLEVRRQKEQQPDASQSNEHDHGDTAGQRESQVAGLPHYCYRDTRNEDGEGGRAKHRLPPIRRGECIAVKQVARDRVRDESGREHEPHRRIRVHRGDGSGFVVGHDRRNRVIIPRPPIHPTAVGNGPK